MSRYNITPKNPKHKMVVGWDNPLETFFAMVSDDDLPEELSMVLWIGTKPEEIKTVTQLCEMVKDYTLDGIPDEVKISLQEDYKNKTEPTPLQKHMRKIVGDLF